ncbi:Retrovirus-related Pol polyprotein from transposon 17.6 [Araneus ventricosus]|uniref:Retrovirus-related Pol polyprotein from transposon 17.6 n=1 Tax=Araneus ventricosus TaxID=182803 RepID=A0A4Y2JYW5_ARAVE|nr:Retrovirus-related Pol polyprotein from transposon 17.6 [Araneus ventricosus]
MGSLAPPLPFRMNSNHVESWKLWKQRFKLYMDSTSLNTKPESQKVAILLHVIGVEFLEIYNTFNEVSSASTNDILAKFEAYFVPQRNITYERQRLFLLVQREVQSVDDLITELRKQLRNCDYGSLIDSVSVDYLVRGLRESRLRERLLRVPDLDIKKAVDMCRAAETSKLQVQVYFTEERNIDAIKRFKPSSEVKPRATGQPNKLRQPAKRQESSGRKCHYCRSHHVPGRCPAYGKRCRSCGKQNNFARVCKSKSDNRVCQNSTVEFPNSANSCKYPPEQFFVGNVSADSMSSSWKAILLISDRPVNFKIDTGAQANIISKKSLNGIYGSGVNLIKNSTVWLWDPSYDKILDRVKEQVTKSPVLAFFDPRVESEIVVDAFPFGLGAVLQQRGKPIAFASSTLTPKQRNYAHIEKELLAVLHGCKKFHQYIYGTKFKIYSDHKPLIAMSKKPLSAMSSRMQRFYLQLQCYDYEIFYKPGEEMFVSDTLSRAPLIKKHFPTTEEDSLVLSVLDSLPISDIKLQEIRDTNKSDPLVQELKSLLECGWEAVRE